MQGFLACLDQVANSHDGTLDIPCHHMVTKQPYLVTPSAKRPQSPSFRFPLSTGTLSQPSVLKSSSAHLSQFMLHHREQRLHTLQCKAFAADSVRLTKEGPAHRPAL
jgi:hypothetical protein